MALHRDIDMDSLPIPAWLHTILRSLLDSDRQSSRIVSSRHGTAQRCGRNDVWRIHGRADDQTLYFAKYCPSQRVFRRELFGLQLMQRLAAENAWLMAAKVVHTNPVHKLIVTQALPGCSLQSLFRTTLRLDQQLLLGKTSPQSLLDAFQQLIALTRLLQAQQADCPDLLDHSLQPVIRRINKKLQRVRGHPFFGRYPELQQLPVSLRCGPSVPDLPRTLVHGDLALSNIFFDGQRIGVIDFEDLGWGPPFRDTLWTWYWLQRIKRRWWHRLPNQLLELIRPAALVSAPSTFYELEFSLLQLFSLERHSTAAWRTSHTEIVRLGSRIAELCRRSHGLAGTTQSQLGPAIVSSA